MAYGILVPGPGVEPAPTALQTTRRAREVPRLPFKVL